MTSARGSSRGKLIAARRRELGLSQEQLAARAGISKPTVQNIEAGRQRNPQPDTLAKIAKALQLSIRELTGERVPVLDAMREAAEIVEGFRPSTRTEQAILVDPELTDEEKVRYLQMLYRVRNVPWPGVNQSGDASVNYVDG
jgi:transcriptional regulator with XRE-family HTH domain